MNYAVFTITYLHLHFHWTEYMFLLIVVLLFYRTNKRLVLTHFNMYILNLLMLWKIEFTFKFYLFI